MRFVSRFVPSAVKDPLRPVYRSLQRSAQSAADRLCTSGLWPRSRAVKDLLTIVSGDLSTTDLYRLAQREFGILQIEAEITAFLDYVAAEKPQAVAEIGMKHGGNSFLFLRMFRDLREFYGLDLALPNVAKLRQLARPGQRLRFIEASSYDPLTVARVARVMGNRQFDFLFVDGDHSYNGVASDLKSYFPFVRPGGLIAFHDIVPDEVARFGARPEASLCYGGDVYLLWQKIRNHFEHREFVSSWDQIGFGIGVIRKPMTPFQLPDEI